VASSCEHGNEPLGLIICWEGAEWLIDWHLLSSEQLHGTMKNGVFWDVTPCGSCKNRRFGGAYRLHHQGKMNR
jgi:hypothetical protein